MAIFTTTFTAMTRVLLLSAALAVPQLALAHVGPHDGANAGFAAFSAAFTHPFLGWDHLIAMVVVGLWSALVLRPVWAAPLAFSVMLGVGALMGWGGGTLANLLNGAVEPMVAVSVLVLGILLWRADSQRTAAVGVVVAGFFAVFHGLSHGAELASGASAYLSLAGLLLGTLVLHCTGLLMGYLWLAHRHTLRQSVGVFVTLFGAALLLRWV